MSFRVGITLLGVIDVWTMSNRSTLPGLIKRIQAWAQKHALPLSCDFFCLYEGLKWQLLPDVVYTKHLVGSLQVVFVFVLLIVLWSGGIFDRR